MVGRFLGQYQILAKLGEGGMGEVYRARDNKLKRDVAIKVLPDSVAADAARLARFQREAEVLASLNHPNIAAIYGLEDADGQTALVIPAHLAQQGHGGPHLLDVSRTPGTPATQRPRSARTRLLHKHASGRLKEV